MFPRAARVTPRCLLFASKGCRPHVVVPAVSQGRSRYAAMPLVNPIGRRPHVVVPDVNPCRGPNIMVGPGRSSGCLSGSQYNGGDWQVALAEVQSMIVRLSH